MSAVGENFNCLSRFLQDKHTRAILYQRSLVFHLLLCRSASEKAQELTAVWA